MNKVLIIKIDVSYTPLNSVFGSVRCPILKGVSSLRHIVPRSAGHIDIGKMRKLVIKVSKLVDSRPWSKPAKTIF